MKQRLALFFLNFSLYQQRAYEMKGSFEPWLPLT